MTLGSGGFEDVYAGKLQILESRGDVEEGKKGDVAIKLIRVVATKETIVA